MEILCQLKGPLHVIFVPVGDGGLIAGIAAYIKRVCPEVKIFGVEPSDANAMALSLYHGQRVMLETVGKFADGVAVKVVGGGDISTVPRTCRWCCSSQSRCYVCFNKGCVRGETNLLQPFPWQGMKHPANTMV